MNKISEDYFLLEMLYLSKDKYIRGHKSHYIEQKQKSRLQLQDFKPILIALDALHSKDYVHSDVRAANLLFPENDKVEAKLIDFDLAGYKGTHYPLGYTRTS